MARPSILSRIFNQPARPAGRSPGTPATPVNQVMPPWARSSHSGGANRLPPHVHRQIQHPAVGHQPKMQATPFVEGIGAANGQAGNPRHQPPFTGAGGLFKAPRK